MGGQSPLQPCGFRTTENHTHYIRTVQSTPLQWLTVLAIIEPPHIRRSNTALNDAEKIARNTALPTHEDGVVKPRLKLL